MTPIIAPTLSAGEILKFHLHLVDGVLAFGESIRRIYAMALACNRAWTFHEAADVRAFHPARSPQRN